MQRPQSGDDSLELNKIPGASLDDKHLYSVITLETGNAIYLGRIAERDVKDSVRAFFNNRRYRIRYRLSIVKDMDSLESL